MINISKSSHKKLEDFLGLYILSETLKLNDLDVEKVKSIDCNHYTEEHFEVNNNNEMFNVNFIVSDNDILHMECNCNVFKRTSKCKHIGLTLAVYYENGSSIEENKEDISIRMYNEIFEKSGKKITIKLIPILNFHHFNVNFKLKVGIDKEYLIGNKIWKLISCLDHGVGQVEFGKSFTYDSSKHEFSDIDKKIIYLYADFIKLVNYGDYKNVNIDYNKLDLLLSLLVNKLFEVEGYGTSIGYEESNPINISVEQSNDNFLFNFNLASIKFLSDNCKYYYNNKLYKVPKDAASILNLVKRNNQNYLLLDETKALNLNKKIRKNFVNIDLKENIKDKFNIIVPKVKLYIDYEDSIYLELKFIYLDNEIDYFDDFLPFRNEDFEMEVVNTLESFNFVISENKFGINNILDVGDFFENGIINLANIFDVYTTSNFKNNKFIKNPVITSQFSLGQDNIMTYSFDLGVIDKTELDDLFNSIKIKKKYHKLKNGSVINTESNDLNELMNVMDSLDIYDLNGTISKYRSLYLNSIKDYNIVNTNSYFKEFINNFNRYKDSDIFFKNSDRTILRDYQIEGTKWLYNIYKTGFGGILADEMGLGKTVQTIMFLKNVLKEKKDSKILIVAPTALVFNWGLEIMKFAPEFNYKILNGSKNQRIEDLYSSVNIFITTYGMLRQDVNEYRNIDFDLIVIDEAQNIKNPKAGISKSLKSLKANVKLALTGTPVENSILEVWSIFDFIMPGYLNSLSKFQSKFMFKDLSDDAHDKLTNLSKLINPFILRRKKKDVLKDLPDKMENIIYLDLPEEQKKIYAMQVKKTKEEIDTIVKGDGFDKSKFKILQLLTRLRQICIDPSLIFDNYKSDSIKLEEVVKLLKIYIENGHKVLLFTSFKSALVNLRKKLEENNISNFTIDGSVSAKNRQNLVDSFNKDDTNVFLITLKAGGTGLNLTSADVVIHYDLWWNPQVENQATDRAHRIGQKRNVEVIKMVCKGTIEEKIISLQNKKRIMSDKLIDSEELDKMILSKLTENDIKDLLAYTE